MQIKKYNSFILERLGVPEGIVESATKLFDIIIEEFKNQYDKLSFGDISLIQQTPDLARISFEPQIELIISDIKLDKIKFVTQVYFKPEKTDIKVVSWGVAFNIYDIYDYRIKPDLSSRDINLNLNLVANKEDKFVDIINHLLEKRNKTIGILSHELKHVYDKYKIGTQLLSNLVDYKTWISTTTGFKPLDKFIYYLYVISKTESLVRSSEIAGELKSSDITKSEFKKFLENSDLYKELLTIKNWSYDELKKELMTKIDDIKNQFIEIPEDESDLDIVNTTLEITYDSLMDRSSDIIEDLLDLNNTIKLLSNKIKESDVKFYQDYFKKRTFRNVDDFFLFWQKKLNFEADKVIRKISKLYDMCKDDKQNPLMVKINDRIAGQYIVDPQLYRELILGSKDKKIKYPK